jgi:hypothetical protein
MDEQSKRQAESLAKEVDLNLREVVQRVIASAYTPGLDRDPKTAFRSISDTERLNFSLDYVFLDEREKWLAEEKARLRKKYLELKKAIELEEADCQKEKERLLSAIRYSVVREELNREKASAPTNLITASKDLAQK